MEQSWQRTREVLTADAQNVSANILVIEIYLNRGWPGKARKLLARLRQLSPDHPRIPELEARACAPRTGLPRNAESLARSGTPAQLVTLAEQFLSLGRPELGKKLLGRALRGEPRNISKHRIVLLGAPLSSLIHSWPCDDCPGRPRLKTLSASPVQQVWSMEPSS